MEQFKKLGLDEAILKSIEEHKFETPTEIQEKAIPLVLGNKDVIAGAATGSGKTLVFGSVIIHNCSKKAVVQSLVLVPTRELADQVAKSLQMFAKHKPLEIIEIYGGVSMGPQVQKLQYADVVVGTPGRILDHLGRETLDLGFVNILVLDEADRMLDMGFIEDVKKIISYCPTKRQTLLFSATIAPEISKIAQHYMNNPIVVMAEAQVDPSKLTQVYYDVPDNQKFSLLVSLLKEEHSGLVMVFCNTQRNTDFVANNLQENGIDAVAIHGGLSQDKRSRIMGQFHSSKVTVLVCTDVAARGLDIKGVSHVYNYDLPNQADQYIHRIGRTARAGKEGKAVNILASRDYENFSNIKKHNDFKIERIELPLLKRAQIAFKHRPRTEERGFGGRSFSRGRQFRDRGESRDSGGSRGSRFGGRSSGGSSRFSRSDRRDSRSNYHNRRRF